MYVRPHAGADARAFAEAYGSRYAHERFVVLTEKRPPEIRDVAGTNDCAIGWTIEAKSGMAVIVSVIDNLGKGAAGQAIQNFNAMLGYSEKEGLDHPGLRSLMRLGRIIRDPETETPPRARTLRSRSMPL